MKRVLVFGTFDEIHPGHMAFFQEALNHGEYIIVVLAQDDTVLKLKNREPVLAFEERKKALEALTEVGEVIPGDLQLGVYTMVSEAKPDLIAFGYDQEDLKEDFERFAHNHQLNIPSVTLSPHNPDVYKSSLLN